MGLKDYLPISKIREESGSVLQSRKQMVFEGFVREILRVEWKDMVGFSSYVRYERVVRECFLSFCV